MLPIGEDFDGGLAMSFVQVTLASAAKEPVFVSNYFADVVLAASPAAALIALLFLLKAFSSEKDQAKTIPRRRSLIVSQNPPNLPRKAHTCVDHLWLVAFATCCIFNRLLLATSAQAISPCWRLADIYSADDCHTNTILPLLAETGDLL